MVDSSTDDVLCERIESLERGAQIGRYHVLERVGAGGMGVVYAAYDPDLDRRVAIKMLHHDADGDGISTDARAGLMREAQAMAKLSHPNVVAVHDVGVHDGTVFIAMEFVHGETVGEWMDCHSRSWVEVVVVFAAAARGLAAAHQVGLVHRDFKPANVMMSDEGVVKVTDFGLARWRDEHGRELGALPGAAGDDAAVAMATPAASAGVSPTRSGAVMGTPSYMAPEQHLGLPTDARSDQFSFCVALYEALYGRRPFTAESPSALAIEVVEARIPDAPAGTRVPGWLREVLLRGLEADPLGRFDSMAELIAILDRDRVAIRRRRIIAAAVVGLLGVGIAGAAMLEPAATPCADTDAHLAGVWDAPAREAVRAALFATGVGFAQSTWERVEPGLDAYAEAWVEARTDACAATRIRGEQPESLLDRRMACLDTRLRSARSLVGVLSHADPTVVQNAAVMVAELAPVAACADVTALLDEHARPEDPQLAAELDALDEALADAEQHENAGKYPEALVMAQAAVARAEALALVPMTARALLRRGVLEHVNGAERDAERTLQDAFFLAVRHGLDPIAARSAAELVTVVGEVQQRGAEARRWAEHARAHAEAEDDALLATDVLHNLAGVALREGAYDDAREFASAGLAAREQALGPENVEVLASVNMLGLIEIETGQFAAATVHFERALGIAERTLGPDHPELAKPINNLANIAWRQGKYEAARAAFGRALALQRDALGPEHRNVAQLENNLAAVAMSMGELAEAQQRFERALTIWRAALGDEHPQVADELNTLAVVAAARGDLAAARDYDERALVIRERTMPPEHPAIAQNYANLGTDLYRLGRFSEARELHARALAIYEKKLDPSHDDIALALTSIGTDLIELGDADAAVPLLERALGLRIGAEIDPVELAATRWSLARALHDCTRIRDRPRAKILAEQARATFANSPSALDNPVTAIDAWLAASLLAAG